MAWTAMPPANVGGLRPDATPSGLAVPASRSPCAGYSKRGPLARQVARYD